MSENSDSMDVLPLISTRKIMEQADAASIDFSARGSGALGQ